MLSPTNGTSPRPSSVSRRRRLSQITRLKARWAGLRTFAPDRTPVVGFSAEREGFFWLAGQGGYGIQTAPALSRAAAALILESPLPEGLRGLGAGLAVLSPGRFEPPRG